MTTPHSSDHSCDSSLVEAELARLRPTPLTSALEQRILDFAQPRPQSPKASLQAATYLFRAWMLMGAAAAVIVIATAWIQLAAPPAPMPTVQEIALQKQRIALYADMIASLR